MPNYTEMTQEQIDTVVEEQILPHVLDKKTKAPKKYDGQIWFHVKVATKKVWKVGIDLTDQLRGTGIHGRMLWNGDAFLLKKTSIDSDNLFTLSFMKEVIVTKSQFQGMSSKSDFT